jgi:hypothetical protein
MPTWLSGIITMQDIFEQQKTNVKKSHKPKGKNNHYH